MANTENNYRNRNNATKADIVITVILFLSMLICLIPVLNTLAISLSDKYSAGAGKVYIWPVNFTLAPYMEILKDDQFFRSFGVSIERVLLGGTLNVLLVILTAYPLSKSPEDFRWKNVYMWIVIFTMLFYGGLIPSYLVVMKLRLINTIWALILPGAVNVFNVLIMMNYYRTIPVSLEEAAKMDGANPLYILWKVYVPLSKPTIAVIALFSVVNHWNEFFAGLIYINEQKKLPLQSYIQTLTVGVDFQKMNSLKPQEIMRQLEISNLTFNSAKIMVSMIPIIAIYPFLQRYFVSGIVLGAVKE